MTREEMRKIRDACLANAVQLLAGVRKSDILTPDDVNKLEAELRMHDAVCRQLDQVTRDSGYCHDVDQLSMAIQCVEGHMIMNSIGKKQLAPILKALKEFAGKVGDA